MTVSAAKKQANYKWDKENMSNLAVRLRKSYVDEIKQACKACNTTPSAIMRKAIDDFMIAYRAGSQDPARNRIHTIT